MSFGSNGATRQDKQQTQTTRATQILPASRSLTENLPGFWNKIIQIVYIRFLQQNMNSGKNMNWISML